MPQNDRNYKQEKLNGQLELISGLTQIRVERRADVVDIMQLAQIFALCSLPYRPTSERQITHVVRLGDGSRVEVIFTAMRPKVEIAYGKDRSMLYWLIDRAITEKTAHITWEHASDYLKAMGLAESGRNRDILKQRFRRIASTAITVVRISEAGEQQQITPIVERMSLPASIAGDGPGVVSIDRRNSAAAFGLELSNVFLKDVMEHRIPMLRSLLVVTKERPQLQDVMFFLVWRSYAAGSESFIKWDGLRRQFWQSDSNIWRIKSRFDEAIKLLRVAWPELEATATMDGLRIAPPRNGIQFIPQFSTPKHIQARQVREKREETRTALRTLFPNRGF